MMKREDSKTLTVESYDPMEDRYAEQNQDGPHRIWLPPQRRAVGWKPSGMNDHFRFQPEEAKAKMRHDHKKRNFGVGDQKHHGEN